MGLAARGVSYKLTPPPIGTPVLSELSQMMNSNAKHEVTMNEEVGRLQRLGEAVSELGLGRAVDELDNLVADKLLQEAQSNLVVLGGTSVPELLTLRDAGGVVLVE